jgi:cell fate (sporulation/competence/biofilm development) regulator YlbF (YheA/YmcA/DUF963 family)
VILEKAQELGRMIGQHDEYRALRQAEQELDAAPELKKKVDRLRDVSASLEQKALEGSEPPDELKNEYEALLSAIQADSRYQCWVAAQANLEKLMLRVHEQIADGVRKGADSPIITLG